jgi:hypothetical protein
MIPDSEPKIQRARPFCPLRVFYLASIGLPSHLDHLLVWLTGPPVGRPPPAILKGVPRATSVALQRGSFPTDSYSFLFSFNDFFLFYTFIYIFFSFVFFNQRVTYVVIYGIDMTPDKNF